jgi:hypothetical protein
VTGAATRNKRDVTDESIPKTTVSLSGGLHRKLCCRVPDRSSMKIFSQGQVAMVAACLSPNAASLDCNVDLHWARQNFDLLEIVTVLRAVVEPEQPQAKCNGTIC